MVPDPNIKDAESYPFFAFDEVDSVEADISRQSDMLQLEPAVESLVDWVTTALSSLQLKYPSPDILGGSLVAGFVADFALNHDTAGATLVGLALAGSSCFSGPVGEVSRFAGICAREALRGSVGLLLNLLSQDKVAVAPQVASSVETAEVLRDFFLDDVVDSPDIETEIVVSSTVSEEVVGPGESAAPPSAAWGTLKAAPRSNAKEVPPPEELEKIQSDIVTSALQVSDTSGEESRKISQEHVQRVLLARRLQDELLQRQTPVREASRDRLSAIQDHRHELVHRGLLIRRLRDEMLERTATAENAEAIAEPVPSQPDEGGLVFTPGTSVEVTTSANDTNTECVRREMMSRPLPHVLEQQRREKDIEREMSQRKLLQMRFQIEGQQRQELPVSVPMSAVVEESAVESKLEPAINISSATLERHSSPLISQSKRNRRRHRVKKSPNAASAVETAGKFNLKALRERKAFDRTVKAPKVPNTLEMDLAAKPEVEAKAEVIFKSISEATDDSGYLFQRQRLQTQLELALKCRVSETSKRNELARRGLMETRFAFEQFARELAVEVEAREHAARRREAETRARRFVEEQEALRREEEDLARQLVEEEEALRLEEEATARLAQEQQTFKRQEEAVARRRVEEETLARRRAEEQEYRKRHAEAFARRLLDTRFKLEHRSRQLVPEEAFGERLLQFRDDTVADDGTTTTTEVMSPSSASGTSKDDMSNTQPPAAPEASPLKPRPKLTELSQNAFRRRF